MVQCCVPIRLANYNTNLRLCSTRDYQVCFCLVLPYRLAFRRFDWMHTFNRDDCTDQKSPDLNIADSQVKLGSQTSINITNCLLI